MTLAQTIKTKLALSGINQEQLCRMTGIHKSRMSRMMNGKQSFKNEDLKAISLVLGDDLLYYIPGYESYITIRKQMESLDEIRESLNAYLGIIGTGNCMNCNNKEGCEFLPMPGEPLRYNCPHYEGKDADMEAIKSQ